MSEIDEVDGGFVCARVWIIGAVGAAATDFHTGLQIGGAMHAAIGQGRMPVMRKAFKVSAPNAALFFVIAVPVLLLVGIRLGEFVHDLVHLH